MAAATKKSESEIQLAAVTEVSIVTIILTDTYQAQGQYLAEHTKMCTIKSGREVVLAKKTADSAELEEAIVHVQGYIISVNLPPLRQSQ